jgi:hypothetical protein
MLLIHKQRRTAKHPRNTRSAVRERYLPAKGCGYYDGNDAIARAH